jgi:hypothetical protein
VVVTVRSRVRTSRCAHELRLAGLGGGDPCPALGDRAGECGESLQPRVGAGELVADRGELSVGGRPGAGEPRGEVADPDVVSMPGGLGIVDPPAGDLLGVGAGVRGARAGAGRSGMVGRSAHRAGVTDHEPPGELGGDTADPLLLDLQPGLLEVLGVVDRSSVEPCGGVELLGQPESQLGSLPSASQGVHQDPPGNEGALGVAGVGLVLAKSCDLGG